MKQVGSIAIDEDIPFQERTWRVERTAWLLGALFLLAAIAGLFGGGPISKARAGSPQTGLWIDYERLLRVDAPVSFRIHMGLGTTENGEPRIVLDRAFQNLFVIERIDPEPARSELRDEGIAYVFGLVDAGRPPVVTLDVRARRAGRFPLSIAAGSGGKVSFAVVVYP